MIYEDYFKKFLKYKEEKSKINKLEDKKIVLMGMVDVQASNPNKGNKNDIKDDKMSRYAAELEELENKIKKKKNLINEIVNQMKCKELELKDSDELLDKAYYFKYIKKYKWFQLCTALNFEKTRMYEKINKLDENLSKIKRTEKNGKN